MKSVSPGLAAHLAGAVTTLATCWRVQRADGAVYGFTDHDRDLLVDGLTYASSSGYARAAIASRADLSVDDTEIAGILNSSLITEADLRAGLWDGAEVRIFLVNWADLSQGVLRLRRGRIGEVIAGDDGGFRAELRGLAQALQQQVGEMYSAECRADLGDARCKVPLRPPLAARSTAYALGDVVRVQTNPVFLGTMREQGRFYACTVAGVTAPTAPTFNATPLGATTTDGSVTWTVRQAWTFGGRVQASSDPATIQAESLFGINTLADGWFEGGVLTMETGANAGVARDVLSWAQATRTAGLFLPMPFPIAAGDVFRLQPGCDKRLATCRQKFANRLNFRGEPHVPGGRAMVETPA
jgi:hypothetical protein